MTENNIFCSVILLNDSNLTLKIVHMIILNQDQIYKIKRHSSRFISKFEGSKSREINGQQQKNVHKLRLNNMTKVVSVEKRKKERRQWYALQKFVSAYNYHII